MSDNQPSESNPFTTRRFIVAAVIVGVVLLCAVVLVVGTVIGGQAKPTTGPTPSSTATHSTATDADPSVCGLKGYEATSSLDDAPKSDWQLVGTIAAPTDRKGAGPGKIDTDGFRSCYAHTATGALYASANFIALGSDATTRAKLPSLIAPGPGRDAAKARSSESSDSTGYRAQIAGFKVDSYDGKNATIDLALNYSTGQLVSLVLKLTWVEGDWKFIADDSGNLPIPPAALQSLGGYTPWSGA
ncbi:hypothetical protein [Leifsonia sp. 71-9]|uniref:hypothetical protein n=1 Tax=Leifsonia sp. 71-9 TaxID=1895934 RepID=UPI00092B2557|nr:hypothetical protein [Leifsonia sp. 71-9]OJX78868.1 MAG: hypothetical protein BGO91_12990 [Leifsonia sp. 71-9]